MPTERLEVDRDAVPPLSVIVPNEVEPSLNITLPVGVAVPDNGVMVAVNFTLVPKVDGLRLETTAVVAPAGFIVWVNTNDVLPLNVLSPP